MANILEPIKKIQKIKKSAYELITSRGHIKQPRRPRVGQPFPTVNPTLAMK